MMKRVLALLLAALLLLSCSSALAVDTPMIRNSPFYEGYSSADDVWMFLYSYTDPRTGASFDLSTYGNADGKLQMPPCLNTEVKDVPSLKTSLEVNGKTYVLTNYPEVDTYFLNVDTVPLLNALLNADQVTITSYPGNKAVSFTISGKDYQDGLLAYVQTMFDSNVVTEMSADDDYTKLSTLQKFEVK